jgi:Mrp family chromosome partitioning ATPase
VPFQEGVDQGFNLLRKAGPPESESVQSARLGGDRVELQDRAHMRIPTPRTGTARRHSLPSMCPVSASTCCDRKGEVGDLSAAAGFQRTPKGGAGKSTTALVLGTSLASKGASVSIIDCDPNQPIKAWSTGSSRSTVRVLSDVTESRIVPVIDTERAERQFVIVDLEGTASRMVSRAIARSDLVLIPMQASAVDAAQAARAVGLVREEEQVIGRAIPLRSVEWL